MSTESEDLDLNSDVASPNGETEVNGVNAPSPADSGRVSTSETLTDPTRGRFLGGDQELVTDQVKDNKKSAPATELGRLLSGGVDGTLKSAESVDSERKTESVDAGTDVGADTRSVDKGVDVSTDNFDVNKKSLVNIEGEMNTERGREDNKMVAGQAVEKAPGTLEEASVEKEVKEGNCVTYALETEEAGFLGTFPGDDVKHTGDILPCKDSFVSGHVREEENTYRSGNQAMEIDVDVENPENFFDLDVGLEPYVSKDQNVTDYVDSPAASRNQFNDSDLVWGKVRSHPWWPGQILDPSVASEKATKHFKRGSYLIAYFGDHTFAWNEASRIKPFRKHFSQMEKQSSLVDFHDAIDCALEEVSRRVEFGLACSCISEDVYNKIKTQTIVNAGIREESCRRECGACFSSLSSFEPKKLVEYIKSLARLPCHGVTERLKFVTLRAQLLAFHRWKGYPDLPVFETLKGSLETAPKISLPGQEKKTCEVTDSTAKPRVVEPVSSKKSKSMDKDVYSHKRKQSFEDNNAFSKKEKTLSELIAERSLSKKSRNRLDDKTDRKLVSDKKRKVEDSPSDDPAVKIRKSNLNIEDSVSDDLEVNHKKNDLSSEDASKSLPVKPVFRVGASILKVASQLNGSSPLILKPSDSSSKKTVVKNKSKGKPVPRKPQSKDLSQTETSSLDEMLLHLFSAAENPVGNFSSLMPLTSFFADFRNSVSLDHPDLGEFEMFLEQASGSCIQENLGVSGITETSESNDVKGPSEDQVSLEIKNEAPETVATFPVEKDIPEIVQTHSNSHEKPSNETLPAGHSDQSCKEESSEEDDDSMPTALILNFTDLSSVPTEDNLNKIFSHYGPLRESETEVLKKSKRAKVVFRRSEDAETAFSSAGKYSIFGPSLLSYRLKYVTSKPSKDRKGSKKDMDSTNGTAS